jgi:hypothetical protein
MDFRSQGKVVAIAAAPSQVQRFSVRDRITIANSATRIRELGIVRVDLHTYAEHGDPNFGDFLLLYTLDHPWSRWGVGCCGRGFLLWRSATGVSCGYFDTVDEALEALIPESEYGETAAQPKRRRRHRVKAVPELPGCFTSW